MRMFVRGAVVPCDIAVRTLLSDSIPLNCLWERGDHRYMPARSEGAHMALRLQDWKQEMTQPTVLDWWKSPYCSNKSLLQVL